MKFARESWPLSSVLLLLSGAALIPVGLYFVLLRPALLPEDLRYIGNSLSQLEAGAPRLTSWLRYVFRVMGGYVIATGVLTIALATTSFRTHHRGAAAGALLAGLVSIGGMVIVNFLIGSDFRWVLLGVGLLWASGLIRFWFEG